MRWTAKASLLAGVAAMALVVGPTSHTISPEANGLRELVPLQLGTPAEAQARVSVGVFFDRLAPHGRWARHGSHGYVFVPAGLSRDWRPYTEGHWAYTDDYGWYWVSDEPFGWATYHYGRWGYSRSYGWYWVPGNVWAPAWVTWRTGGDYVGWAPIAPEGRGYAWGAPSSFRPPVAESWVFVETRYVSAPTILQYVEPIPQIPVILAEATTRVDIRIEQNIVINQPIEITQIENVVVEPMQTVNVTFVDDPDQATASQGEVVAFQADISEEEPQEVPTDAVESADQIQDPAIIDEILEEVPAEADAPSAAEVDDDSAEPATGGAMTDGSAVDEAPAAPAATGQEPASDGTTGDATADEVDGEEPATDAAAEDEPAAEEPGVEEPVGTDEQPVEDETPAAEEVTTEPEIEAEEAAPTDGEPAEETAPAQTEEAAPTEEIAPEDEATPDEGEEPAPEAPAEAAPEEAPVEQAPAEDAPVEESEAVPAEQPADAKTCPEGQETC